MPKRSRRSLLLVLFGALAGCGHGDPFQNPAHDTAVPFAVGTPTRLTFNPGSDRDAAWLPDGSGIIYSADQRDRDDNDRCIVRLPVSGGRIERLWCNNLPPSRDSINAFDAAAFSVLRQIAFVRSSRPVAATSDRFRELAIAGIDSITRGYTLLQLPTDVFGRLYRDASHIRWLDAGTLVYRADFNGNVCIAAGTPCPMAPVSSGMDVVIQTTVAGGIPGAVPGTAMASSVTVDESGDAIYYTLQADDRVYRRVLATGATTVIYTFTGDVVRGVQVTGSRVIVVVGGVVSIIPPATTGLPFPIQRDFGGTLMELNMATGVVTPVSLPADSTRYQRPALSPDGRRLIVEADGDLWLFDLP